MKVKTIRNRVRSIFDEYRAQTTGGTQSLNVRNDDGQASIYIYDVIDDWWGVSASQIITELSKIKVSDIAVHVHSPGGDVFEGAAIMSALANHPARITTHNDGLAASMASGLMMSGSARLMSEGAFMMIHEPWSIAAGNADDFRQYADFLDQHTSNLAQNYYKRTVASNGLSKNQVMADMKAETWYTAEEALAAGLIDEITETVPVNDEWSASGQLQGCKNTPDKIKTLVQSTDGRRVQTQQEFSQFLRDELGLPSNMAKAVAKNGFHPELSSEAGADEDELLNEADLLDLSSELDSLYLKMRL